MSLKIFSSNFGGHPTSLAATDQQDTCPTDVTKLPVPPDAKSNNSPETSAEERRGQFQRLRKKTSVGMGDPLPRHHQGSATASTAANDQESKEAWQGLGKSGRVYKQITDHQSYFCRLCISYIV